jgi:hypothetical protein
MTERGLRDSDAWSEELTGAQGYALEMNPEKGDPRLYSELFADGMTKDGRKSLTKEGKIMEPTEYNLKAAEIRGSLYLYEQLMSVRRELANLEPLAVEDVLVNERDDISQLRKNTIFVNDFYMVGSKSIRNHR